MTEIDLLLKKYECESADFREFLHTAKPEKSGINGKKKT